MSILGPELLQASDKIKESTVLPFAGFMKLAQRRGQLHKPLQSSGVVGTERLKSEDETCGGIKKPSWKKGQA